MLSRGGQTACILCLHSMTLELQEAVRFNQTAFQPASRRMHTRGYGITACTSCDTYAADTAGRGSRRASTLAPSCTRAALPLRPGTHENACDAWPPELAAAPFCNTQRPAACLPQGLLGVAPKCAFLPHRCRAKRGGSEMFSHASMRPDNGHVLGHLQHRPSGQRSRKAGGCESWQRNRAQVKQ